MESTNTWRQQATRGPASGRASRRVVERSTAKLETEGELGHTGGEQADGHQQHVFLLVQVELLQAHLELDQRLQQLQSVTRCMGGRGWGKLRIIFFDPIN